MAQMTDRFYEAQCVKDEAMGEAIADAFTRAPKGTVVFQVDGAFHSDFGLGTAERARRRLPKASSVVITADILLADRCLKAGAVVIGNNGKPFTSSSIGGAIATRAIMADLRAGMDGIGGGPAPFAKADRSRFLQALDEALVRMG